MARVTVITDGSADNITGTGGWAAIVRSPSELVEVVGCATGTTSNRMELTAAIEGLRSVKEPSEIDLVADSAYVLNTIKNGWYHKWLTEVRAVPRPNLDLWMQLIGLLNYHDVRTVKVKGHSGDYWNERADRLADHARRNSHSATTTIENWEEGLRCMSQSPSKKLCRLHLGHDGGHQYRTTGTEIYGGEINSYTTS